MKTTIVNEAVAGRSVAVALKSGVYTVAGTGLCGLGSVLDTVADVGQKVVDATRAAGEACTTKGEEFLVEAAAIKGEQPAKKEEEKVEAQAPKQQKSSKTWSLADFVAQHNEFAAAASAVIKEYTKVVFRAKGSMKGVVTAFDAIRRADGVHCSVFADMAEKTFSVVAPPKKKEEPAEKAVKKAAAPKQEKASKKAAPVKEAVKAEPAKTEEAAEENSMKAALEAARAKKTAVKAEAKKEEKSSEKAADKKAAKKTAPVREAAKAEAKVDVAADKELAAEAKLAGADDKVVYSTNEKANAVLTKAVTEYGKWIEAIICYFRNSSATSPIRNAVLTKNCLKFSYYSMVNLQSEEKAVSIGLKSKKVKVDRKPVDIAF